MGKIAPYLLSIIALLATTRASFGQSAPAEKVEFVRDVRPIFEQRCVECHGAKKEKSGLRLDLKAAALKGGDSHGPDIISGKGAASPLIKFVQSADAEEQMPPKGERLSAAQIATLTRWIDQGAPWPDGIDVVKADDRLSHWSFQPLTRPALPETKDQSWPANSIDRFILAKLETQGLKPSPPADRRTLIRRAYFDVTGLPPSPEEVERFIADPDPKAYEKLIDRLLASPRFGETWARHWLDVVRFAESDGFEMNGARPNAWPYRDYVIRAFNDDKPYNQFIREQLAGDALGQDAATGFLVAGPSDLVKSPDPVLTANQRADELHDMVGTTAAAFLGLTVNCARCHDHKFDPIPTKDYYALIADFQGVGHGERSLRRAGTSQGDRHLAELRKALASAEAKLAELGPKARIGRLVLIDEACGPASSNTPGATPIGEAGNGPVAYSPGREKGQADDPGDALRLPNIGQGYRYWNATPEKPQDLWAWSPRLAGKYRIWVSWAAWTTHAKDARYLLDLESDGGSSGGQKELATIDQSHFADGTPAMPGQKRWSGFRSVGVYDLKSASRLILRSGELGGPTSADVVAFEEVSAADGAAVPKSPHVRAAVTGRANDEVFEPVSAKFVRFSITASSSSEPCLDELEVFTAGADSRNVALTAAGAKVTVSGTYLNGGNPKHQAAHLNDGLYGNDFSWISDRGGSGWVQVELAQPQRIGRIVWSRDRSDEGRAYDDRLAIGYSIEVSEDAKTWRPVASSDDRLGPAYRERIKAVPTLDDGSTNQAAEVAKLLQDRTRLTDEIRGLAQPQRIYAGAFSQPGATHRNNRGDPMQPQEVVTPGALSLIGPPLTLPPDVPEQQRRLALADWIANPRHPLTARVAVNRLWHYHFGTGIVDTPSDFGLNGSRPTHPELLDWLADELVTQGWSLKHVHRLILLSNTYQQAGTMDEAAFKLDSSARLLWRFPARRLEAEALRDAMLAVSGKLDLTMGGPGFDLFEPNTNYVKVYASKSMFGPSEFRRMVYQSKPRMVLDDSFGAFDCPDAGQPAAKRTSSITPLQALNLLNGAFAMQQAEFFAQRLKDEAGNDPAAQISRAFLLAFGRKPTADEAADSNKFIAHEGLTLFCRALLNANEFIRLN